MLKNNLLISALTTALLCLSGYAWSLHKALKVNSRLPQANEVHLSQDQIAIIAQTQIDLLASYIASIENKNSPVVFDQSRLDTIEAKVIRVVQQVIHKELAVFNNRLNTLEQTIPAHKQAQTPLVPEYEKPRIQLLLDRFILQHDPSFNSPADLGTYPEVAALSPQGQQQLLQEIIRLINSGEVHLQIENQYE